MLRRKFFGKLFSSTGAVILGTQCRQPIDNKGNTNLLPQDSLAATESAGAIFEPAREIPISDTADVLVVGGGPAGVAAAIAASRGGARTILIERYNHLGGLWTGGLVLPLLSTHGVNTQKKQLQVIHGISDEIVQQLNKIDMAIEEINPVIDPEAAKYVLEVMLKEAGVKVYYHCWASNVVVENNDIKGVIFETKSGRLAIKPKVVIDCTGDGDVFHWAGESYEMMNYEIGLVHRLGNIDRIDKSKPGYKEMKIGGTTPIPGVNWVNMSGGQYENGIDFKKLSELQRQHRFDIWDQVQEIRSTPGYEKVFLLDTACQQGVRMSRILDGEYQLTLEDSMTYQSFDDVIGISGGWISVLYEGRRTAWRDRPMWQIPYRSLLPKKTQNLLVAGRCISFEKDLFQDTRIIGTCLVTGQGAGAAAAIASNQDKSTREVDINELQQLLKKQNVFLG